MIYSACQLAVKDKPLSLSQRCNHRRVSVFPKRFMVDLKLPMGLTQVTYSHVGAPWGTTQTVLTSTGDTWHTYKSVTT